jgi:hypothetical protein
MLLRLRCKGFGEAACPSSVVKKRHAGKKHSRMLVQAKVLRSSLVLMLPHRLLSFVTLV